MIMIFLTVALVLIQEAASANGSSLIPQISNIEVIQVTNNIADDSTADDDTLTIALSSVTGIESLAAIAGGDGVTFYLRTGHSTCFD